MICYQDRTFCTTPGCTKEHALTPAIEAAANRAGLPLSVASLCIARIMPVDEQLRRWVAGDPVHNGATRTAGECCPDFSCCNPSLLAPSEEREAYVAAGEAERMRMLMMFLGRGCSAAAPEKRVHVTGPAREEVVDG